MPSARSGRVAGVVLAAGSSSRLGANKLLLTLGRETVVRRAARQAVEAELSPVVVVLGFEAEQVEAALEGLTVEPVVNPDYAVGLNASLRVGIAQVPPDCDAALVLLADMPLVTARMLAQMVSRFRAGREPLVVSLYGDVPA
ncbi:MAG: nucleotidyltransferase family protein, partial [Gemmatimonadales bacterium]